MSINIRDLNLRREAKHVLYLRDWQIEQAAQGLLIGPSGSGKTTCCLPSAG